MRRLALAACTLLMVASAAAPAWAQRAGQVPTANFTDQTPAPGSAVTVEGEGWERGSRIEILFEDTLIGTTTADRDGTFETEVRIPEDADEGRHTATVRGRDGEGNPTRLQTQLVLMETQSPRGSYVILALLGAALAVVLVIAAILLLRRRGGGPVRQEGGPTTQEPSPIEAGRRRQQGR